MRISWTEFVEHAEVYYCVNCEEGKPDRGKEKCMNCLKSYIKNYEVLGLRVKPSNTN